MGVWGKGLSGFAVFEPPAFVAGLDDVAMVGQPVEERGGHLGIAEHLWPFAERQVGGDDNRGLFVEAADEMEQQLPARQRERQIAELIEDDEIDPRQMIGDASRFTGAGLGLEPVDQIDGVEEADPGNRYARRRGQ